MHRINRLFNFFRLRIFQQVAVCPIFYQKNEELKGEMVQLDNKKDSLVERKNAIEGELKRNKSQMKMVEFNYPQKGGIATINVYWDSTSRDVYLVLKDLGPLSADQKYQLWAITAGKHKSLGLFDAPADDKLILKMNNVQQADSFSITIEKTGIHAPFDSIK